MARSVSDEELQLKKRARRRLIGAIVLVTAVAVVLPMVLDSEPRSVSQDIKINIPSPDSGAFTSKVAPLPAAQPSTQPPVQSAVPDIKQVPVAEPKPAMAVKEIAKAPEKTDAEKASAKAPALHEAPAKAVPAAKAARKEAHAESFVVQVVALSDAVKAKEMKQHISSAGIKAYTEVVKTAKGDVTRVRVGPFTSRKAAEKAQQQLKAIGLDGKVIPK